MSDLAQQILILLSYFLGFLVFLITVFFAIKYFVAKRKSGLSIFRKTVLLVTMPREFVEGDQEKALSLQNIQEKIGIMEAIYANISGLSKSMNFKSLFSGPKNHLAFEIVVKNGIISFYIAVPKNLKQFIIQQIQAQYPNAHIEETEDYNIFSPQGFIDGVYLQLNNSSIFPIKSYKHLQSDPLNALINALSKMEKDDGAVIQFIIRPAQSNWRSLGSKVVSEVRKGRSLKSAIGNVGNSKSGVLASIGGDIGKSLLGPGASGESKPAIQETHKMSPMEEESVKKIEEKISKSGLEANIRIIVSADKKDQVDTYLENIVNSFGQYNVYEYGNSFKSTTVLRQKNIVNNFIYRDFNQSKKIVLNSEEMASLFHFPLASSQTPNIQWLSSKEAPAPNNIPDTGIVLGENVYREVKTLIKINRSDRTRHIYAIGKSGTGKSEFLSNMAKQDILNGDGVAVIDPHGDLVRDILDTIPNERAEDVIYFDPANIERPMGINLLEYNKKYPEQKTFVINEMISIFDKLYDLKQTGGPMFEQYMRNAMLLVMEDPESGSTLMEISKVLADADFRRYKLSKCLNPVVKDFWQKE
ncbi:type IV secretion system DNA-binding domain-containing protein, partial [bacterium]|nr:type IV secretion system DNA-binding domain-containing protein [bacterium]